MLPVGKIFAGLFVLIIYYILTVHVVTDYLLNSTSSNRPPDISTPKRVLTNVVPDNLYDLQWVHYNNYGTIPYF